MAPSSGCTSTGPARKKLWGERRGLRHHRCADTDGGAPCPSPTTCPNRSSLSTMINRVQFETRRFQFRSSPPLGDLGRLVLRVSNWTRFSTLVCVIEVSGSSWLVAATVPGVARRPRQKVRVNPTRLLEQVERWRKGAERSGRTIQRVVVAY